ncbi:serine/threonine-protein kinase [Microtetraspora malaysiensis]|uniref:serine/threonine-protein kinase n=1 Tax=Microtetraspora malaysiensis TaxID=161358 RepID=UPI000836A561|nr:serine/threonine-protein kinase [Microtetraspora malaysiensis]
MADWAPGIVVAGDFVVERELGRGGFGRVVLVNGRRSGKRYAVKRLASADLAEQGRLLAEAQRWVSLPAHPHITACRFVRTIGDEVAVFSEYAPGGSLADRIAAADLRAAEIPAIALQTAWGLDTVHALGMLHLDVKPANVLFDADGTAKLADFGLAARNEMAPEATVQLEALVDYIAGDDLGELGKHLVWSALAEDTLAAVPSGRTSAYASPEQAEGRTAGRGADLWSWAVTVLEMYVGERRWPSGTVAPYILDALERGQHECRIPIPAHVARMLRLCFALDPADRPRSLLEAAEALRPDAPHLTPPERLTVLSSSAPRSRKLGVDAEWDDPRGYLNFAYERAGRDPAEAVEYWPRRGGGFTAHALADLYAFQHASDMLSTAPTTEDQIEGLARIRWNQAQIQRVLGDGDKAIRDLEAAATLLADTGTARHHAMRAVTLLTMATALREQGRHDDAIAAGDEAIRDAAHIEDSRKAASLRGSVLLAQANAVIADGGAEQAVIGSLRTALDEFRAAENLGGQPQVVALMAVLRDRAGAPDEAAALWAEADRLLNLLDDARQETGSEGSHVLRAFMLTNRAKLASGMEDKLEHAKRAVEILSSVVEQFGRYDLSAELGSACVVAGYAYEHLGMPQESLESYRHGRLLYQDVVQRGGRADLADELSECLELESTLVRNLYGPEQALQLIRVAVDMWRRLANLEGMGEWGIQLVRSRIGLAIALEEAAQPGALDVLDQAARDLAELGPLRTKHLIVQEALIYRGRAVVHRRAGDLRAAYEACATALILLREAGEQPESIDIRTLTLETMSSVLTETGHLEEALGALADAAAETEVLVEMGHRPPAALAGSRHRLANLLFETGRLEEFTEESAKVLDLYARLLTEGRSDLRFDAFRLAYARASALHLLGCLDAAIDVFHQARAFGIELPDDDAPMRVFKRHPGMVRRWQRWVPPRDGGAAELPDATRMLRLLDDQIADLGALLIAEPGDLGPLLADLTMRMEQTRPLGQAGRTYEASRLLEPLLGSALWLSRTHPGEETGALAGEMGLRLGVFSLHAHRDRTAVRGFRTAIDSFGQLAAREAGQRYRDRWFEAHIALAGCLKVYGDGDGVHEVVRKLEGNVRRWAPQQAAYWSNRIRQALDGLG